MHVLCVFMNESQWETTFEIELELATLYGHGNNTLNS